MSYNLNMNMNSNITFNTLATNTNQISVNKNQKFYFQNLIEGPGNKEILTKVVQSNDIGGKIDNSFAETLQQIRYIDNNRPSIIENSNFIRPQNKNNLPEEYSGLSYLSQSNSNSISNPNGNYQNSEQTKGKKSLELDFRVKYKTEKCKFWEINQTCKFGDNVRFIN